MLPEDEVTYNKDDAQHVPKFQGKGAYGVGIGGVRRGVSEFLQVVYTKTLDICYDFGAVFNLIFLTTLFLDKGCL